MNTDKKCKICGVSSTITISNEYYCVDHIPKQEVKKEDKFDAFFGPKKTSVNKKAPSSTQTQEESHVATINAGTNDQTTGNIANIQPTTTNKPQPLQQPIQKKILKETQCIVCYKDTILEEFKTRSECKNGHIRIICSDCIVTTETKDIPCEICQATEHVPVDNYYTYFLIAPEVVNPEENLNMESDDFYVDDEENQLAYVQTRCILFNKTNLKDVKMRNLFCVIPGNQFMLDAIPYYFSSIIALTPRILFVTGGCLGYPPEFSSSKYAYIIIIDRVNDHLDQYDQTKNPYQWDLFFQPQMHFGRHCHKSFIIDDVIYIVGGLHKPQGRQGIWLKSCEALDVKTLKTSLAEENYQPPENEWVDKENMNNGRSNFGGFVYQNCIYVFGGYSNLNTFNTTIEKYDPKKNAWEVVKKDFMNIVDPLCLEVGKYVYIVGGSNGEDKLDLIQRLDCETMQVEIIAKMKFKRALAQGMIKDNKLIVFGGESNLSEIEIFDLKTKNYERNMYDPSIDIDYDAGIDDMGMIGVSGAFFNA